MSEAELVATVVAIALPDCLNPSLIGGELLVATGPQPARRTAAFTLAAWGVTFVFGVALAVGLGDVILSVVPKPSPTVKYGLIAAAGLVLAGGGIVVWVRRGTLRGPEPSAKRPGAGGRAAVLGAGLAGFELLTAFPYFAAIALIVGSGVSSVAKLTLVAVYCVAYTLPLIVIAAVVAILGQRAENVLRPLGTWLIANWPVIVGPMTAAIGMALLAFGIVQLG